MADTIAGCRCAPSGRTGSRCPVHRRGSVPAWVDGEDGEVWPAHGHVWDIGSRCVLCAELAIDAASTCPNT